MEEEFTETLNQLINQYILESKHEDTDMSPYDFGLYLTNMDMTKDGWPWEKE